MIMCDVPKYTIRDSSGRLIGRWSKMLKLDNS